MDNELRRGQIPSSDLINEVVDLAQASTEQSGYGVVKYPGGTQHLPPDIDEIWIMVTGQGSSSSSEVSAAGSSSGFIPDPSPGSGASDPGSVTASGSSGSSSSGTADPLHDNRYAWNQTMVLIDTNGIETHVIDPSGLNGTQDSNPAIEVNSRIDVPEGFICKAYLSPSGNAWHFTYPGPQSSSSGITKMVVDCAAGTIIIGSPDTSSKIATVGNGGGIVTKNAGGSGDRTLSLGTDEGP